MLNTFRINTFGHILTFKHFVPLLPTKKSKGNEYEGSEDPANGVVQPGLNVLASMSARVGSIADNERGGWYSYRVRHIAGRPFDHSDPRAGLKDGTEPGHCLAQPRALSSIRSQLDHAGPASRHGRRYGSFR